MCKDKFDNKKDFEEHNSKVHNGIKPFICTTCGAGFSRNGNLKCHMEAVHEKKRNFSCKISGCEKQFYGKKEFQRHVSQVHEKGTQQRSSAPKPEVTFDFA